MKKRLFALFLALAMLCVATPFGVFAGSDNEIGYGDLSDCKGNHTWNEGPVTTPATCGAAGVKTFTCAVCKTTKTEEIPATGEHNWDEGTVTTPATCTEPGEKTLTCSVCKETKTEPTDALGHDWAKEWTIDEPATTTAPGSKSHHCTRCDEKTDVTVIPVLPTGFATDAETGLTYYYDADGQRNTAERISVDGKWYNFYPAGSTVDGVDVSYSLLSGWMTMPDGTVRYYPDGAYWYKTGSASVDGKTYFFAADTGALYAPAETEYGMAWYVYEAGDLSIYYALDPQDFHWVHGLYEKDGATYYFPAYATEKGYATGFVTVDGERLYFGSDGKLVTDEALIPRRVVHRYGHRQDLLLCERGEEHRRPAAYRRQVV